MAALARTDLAARAAHSTDASTSRRTQPREIPALNGLRGLAVLLVIWCHVRGFTFTPATDWLLQFKSAAGLIGLYLFFVLSGFLLFLPYAAIFAAPANASSLSTRWPNVLRFYRRRAQRILPVFYAAILATLLFATLRPSSGLFPPVPGPRTLLALFTLFHDDLPNAWQYILDTNTPLWSLAVEWQFYLVLPLFALGLRGLHRRLGPTGVLAGILALMAYALGVRAVAAATFYAAGYPTVMQVPGPLGPILTLLYGMNGKYLELFALGMLAALAYSAASHRIAAAPDHTRAIARIARPATLLLAASLLIGLPLNMFWLHAAGIIPTPLAAYVGRWPQEASGAWLWSIAGSWALALCMVGVAFAAVLGPAWVRAPLTWRPLRLVGLISYSLYVWHALVEKLWYAFWRAHWPALASPVVVSVYLILLALIGLCSYYFIERPFLQMRRGHDPRVVAILKRLTARGGQPDVPLPAPASASSSPDA
jgi:peptidoglycan/LPS O-acetylase OafA/YrhL